MRRNFLLDVLLLVASLVLTATGIALWENAQRQRYCGRTRQLTLAQARQPWRLAHACTSLGFLAALVLHLLWHGTWIAENTPKVLHGDE